MMLFQCKPRPIEGLVHKGDKIDSVLIDNIYPSRNAFRLNNNHSIFTDFYYMVEESSNYVTKKIKHDVKEEFTYEQYANISC
ncbi:hypothetical protein GO491_09840 [Flavobacteriaceae bacterium Ap0902]|nr:hypothetical protein [Flavobacteriaceae bacterium Ap0902]